MADKVARIERQIDFGLKFWPVNFERSGLKWGLQRRLKREIARREAATVKTLSAHQKRALDDIVENGGPSENHAQIVGVHGAALEAVHEKLQQKGLIDENLKSILQAQ